MALASIYDVKFHVTQGLFMTNAEATFPDNCFRQFHVFSNIHTQSIFQ